MEEDNPTFPQTPGWRTYFKLKQLRQRSEGWQQLENPCWIVMREILFLYIPPLRRHVICVVSQWEYKTQTSWNWRPEWWRLEKNGTKAIILYFPWNCFNGGCILVIIFIYELQGSRFFFSLWWCAAMFMWLLCVKVTSTKMPASTVSQQNTALLLLSSPDTQM